MTDDTFLRSVQRLSTALARLERQVAARGGVSVSQLRVMIYLHESKSDGIRISDLADDQGLAVSTMTRNLALLEKKGWIDRRQGAEDKRTVLVALNELGREVASELQSSSLGKLGQVFQAFPAADRLERAVALDRVATALEDADEDS